MDVEEMGRLIAPDVVILDEAQRIKNWHTATANAVKKLSSPYAFVLTGTPLENRIDEIYSIFQVIDPHLTIARCSCLPEFSPVVWAIQSSTKRASAVHLTLRS